VYLGPWEVVGSESRRVLWQCSYQGELLEHFRMRHPFLDQSFYQFESNTFAVPSDHPADVFPHTLHARHRPYTHASELELYVTFREPHRVRYTSGDGVVIHDQPIDVKYEFTMVEGSVRFQGDIRRKDMIDFFDADVVWSDVQSRTDGFGSLRGLGMIQRVKLWRDRYTTYHSITVFANRTDRQYREYEIHNFEGELRGRDDRGRQVRLNVRGRRGSADSHPPRRLSLGHRIRPRVRSTGNAGSSSSPDAGSPANALGIRYLGIQFSRREGKILSGSSFSYVPPPGKRPRLTEYATQTTAASLTSGSLLIARTASLTASSFQPTRWSFRRLKSPREVCSLF
jgi:hypothetical protein